MNRLSSLIGLKFERLIVLEAIKTDKHLKYMCKCDCGNYSVVQSFALKSGKTKSCGCLYIELRGKSNFVHGHTKTKTYKIWTAMKQRCYNPKSAFYHRYGGRGIKVCDRWINSFRNFLEDMGEQPSDKLLIDFQITMEIMNLQIAVGLPICNSLKIKQVLAKL